MSDKKTVFSGLQPSAGCITIGNYIGAVKNWVTMQEENNCIYSVVDLHALTVRQVPAELRQRSLSFFAQYLALGLDPSKTILFFQSHVPEHSQLTWVLNCFTYVGEMSRMTQFKEKSEKNEDNINMGLMDYPVLMAADILLYNAHMVPVGADQKQHLEISRDIATRFNNLYSPTFVVPEPYISRTASAKIYSLQEPTVKMAKSDENEDNVVSILDTKDVIFRKFKRAVTDSGDEIVMREDKPGISNLLTIYTEFTGKSVAEAEAELVGVKYGSFKTMIADAVIEKLLPVQAKYSALMADKDALMKVATDGADRARYIASRTLSKVYKKIGLVLK